MKKKILLKNVKVIAAVFTGILKFRMSSNKVVGQTPVKNIVLLFGAFAASCG